MTTERIAELRGQASTKLTPELEECLDDIEALQKEIESLGRFVQETGLENHGLKNDVVALRKALSDLIPFTTGDAFGADAMQQAIENARKALE